MKSYLGAIFTPVPHSAMRTSNSSFFTQEVTKMFTGPGQDLFAGVDGLLTPLAPASNSPQEVPIVPPITTALIALKYPQPQVAELSKAALKCASSGLSFASSKCRAKFSPTSDGWYVAYNAALPGVYCGS